MYEKQIDRFFETHREEYLRDLARLVAVDSSMGDAAEGKPFGDGPAEALKTALEIAAGYGLYTENWENYLGIVQLNNDRERKLDILAHLDVVPADAAEWETTEPFTMKIEGDKVFGRGTADDKGPALAAIYALRAIKELGLKIKDNPRVFLGCNEESGSAELKYYFQRTSPAEMTISPDASFPVINVEKGILVAEIKGSYLEDLEDEEGLPRVVSIRGGSVYNTVAEKCQAVVEGLDMKCVEQACEEVQELTQVAFTCGWLDAEGEEKRIVIDALGTAAHASLPETGNNANAAMLILLCRLPLAGSKAANDIRYISGLFPPGDHHGKAAGIYMEDTRSGAITVCPNVLVYDLMEDPACGKAEKKLSLTIDARLPICFTEDALEPFIDGLSSRGLDYDGTSVMPHFVEEESILIQNLLESYEVFSGEKGYCISMGGLTYCHGIKNAVAFGFADEAVDNRMHGRDEFAEISRLMMGGKIYTLAILKLCNC